MIKKFEKICRKMSLWNNNLRNYCYPLAIVNFLDLIVHYVAIGIAHVPYFIRKFSREVPTCPVE